MIIVQGYNCMSKIKMTPKKKRTLLDLTENDLENINEIGFFWQKRSASDVIAHSLSIAKHLAKQKEAGGRIFIKNKNGSENEIVFAFV